MSKNAVTMTADQVTGVARRVLREPFTARAWRTFLYCLCQPFILAFNLAVVVALLLGSTVSAGLLAPLLIPLLLAFGRRIGSMYRGLARSLLDVDVPQPMRARRRRGVPGFIAYYFGDGIGWRAIGYMLAKILLSIEIVVGVAFRLGLPLTLVGVVGARTGIESVPLLIIWTVLFFASPKLTELALLLDQTLMWRLLGPSEDSLRIRELEQTRSHAINEAAATLRRMRSTGAEGRADRQAAAQIQHTRQKFPSPCAQQAADRPSAPTKPGVSAEGGVGPTDQPRKNNHLPPRLQLLQRRESQHQFPYSLRAEVHGGVLAGAALDRDDGAQSVGVVDDAVAGGYGDRLAAAGA